MPNVCIPGNYKSDYIEKVGKYLKTNLKDVSKKDTTLALKILERTVANKGETEVLEIVHSAITSELGTQTANLFYTNYDNVEIPQEAQIPERFAKGGELLA